VTNLVQQSIFGEAVQNAEVGALILSGQLIVAVNQAVADLTGYTPDEIIGGGVPSLAADEDTRRQREEVFAGSRTSGEGRILRKDGTVVAVRYVISHTRVARDTLMLGLLWPEA
jgi:PAS domain S-box-containing protein